MRIKAFVTYLIALFFLLAVRNQAHILERPLPPQHGLVQKSSNPESAHIGDQRGEGSSEKKRVLDPRGTVRASWGGERRKVFHQ